MDAKRVMVCENCRFYEEGLCKRHPKQYCGSYEPEYNPIVEFWCYPPHAPIDWCGEFEYREDGK